MDEKIYAKIEEIFSAFSQTDEITALKYKVAFDVKKTYNQMMQSGFSEYIAVAESMDYVNKIAEIVKNESDEEKVKELLSDEKKLKENIKNTLSTVSEDENYDKESLDKIVQLVGNAALEEEKLLSTDIEEQNDEIVYKTASSTANDDNTSGAKPKKDWKTYLKNLGVFLTITGLTALVLYLLHLLKAF